MVGNRRQKPFTVQLIVLEAVTVQNDQTLHMEDDSEQISKVPLQTHNPPLPPHTQTHIQM